MSDVGTNAGTEVSAVAALCSSTLSVRRVLNSANATLHRSPNDTVSQSESDENSEIQEGVVHEHDGEHKITSGTRVLKQLGDVTTNESCFGQDVQNEVVSTITALTASVRMLLSLATDSRDESYRAGVNEPSSTASMKEGDVVYARPPRQWQPETKDIPVWQLQSIVYGFRSAAKCRHEPMGAMSMALGFWDEPIGSACLWVHTA